MLFGVNAAAPMLLAVLDLDEGKVGRFRNAFVTSEKEIAIYTRNGGGNRECWHESSPEWGNADCAGDAYDVEVDEVVLVTKAEAEEKGYVLQSVYVGGKQQAKTGRRVKETRHTCKEPSSSSCACPGCIINHRLPLHPLYLRDADDDFDSTYATIFFRFPEAFVAELTALAEETETITPSEQWRELLARLAKEPP